MEIYSFSGPSGTGKSSHALEFAHMFGIEAIIDDGLLIINGEMKAGTSAKFEKNAFKAVKRAIFSDDEHVNAVQVALDEIKPDRLLLIGTSDKMTKLIAERIDRGAIDHFHYISEIKSLKEMKMAQFVRKTEGKHIMPLPVLQVEQNFFKRLIKRGYEIFSNKREKIGETTIVQPDFHAELVSFEKKDYLNQIKQTCENNPVVIEVHKIHFMLHPMPKTKVFIAFNSANVNNLYEQVTKLQNEINKDFDERFGIEFIEISIDISYLKKYKEVKKEENP